MPPQFGWLVPTWVGAVPLWANSGYLRPTDRTLLVSVPSKGIQSSFDVDRWIFVVMVVFRGTIITTRKF